MAHALRTSHWLLTVFFLLQAQGQDAPPVIRSDARLVEVNVVVRDKKTSAPLRNLTRQEFRLFENDRERAILSFSVLDRSSQTPHEHTYVPDNRGVVTNRPLGVTTHSRTVAVLIDAYNARPEDAVYAVRASMDALRRLNSNDIVAVYALTQRGLRVFHHYKDGTAALLAKLQSGESEGTHTSRDVVPEQSGTTVIQSQTMQHEVRVRLLHTLNALRTIGAHLGYLPGRKSVVWLSAGFPFGVVLDNLSVWRTTVEELNSSNIAVFPIDSSGLRTLSGLTADIRTTGTLPTYGRMNIRPTSNNDALWALANATGGALFENRNHLSRAISDAIADSDVVYSLTYAPSPKEWDGRFVPIKVRIDRKGITLRHRSGYYAVQRAIMTEKERDERCRELALSSVEAAGIGLSVPLLSVDSNGTVTVLLVADPNSLSFTKHALQKVGRIDVCYTQLTATGRIAAEFTDDVPVSISAAQFRIVQAEGVAYPRTFARAPDAAKLKIAMIDLNNGNVGSIVVDLP